MMNTPVEWVPSAAGRHDCELCREPGGVLVATAPRWRVIRVRDDDFPAFYRVIWQDHAAEMSDLSPAHRQELWSAVDAVEQAVRAAVRPDKMNLASLGNMVPHLHWHVVARFAWDSHFPQPIWGVRQRELATPAASRLACSLDALDAAVREAAGRIA